MLLKGGGHNKRHVTIAALEYILSCLPMGFHVACQLAALSTGVGAQLTLVGLLAGV